MNTNIKHLYYFFICCFLLIAINLFLCQGLLAPALSEQQYQDEKLVKLAHQLIDRQVLKAGKYVGSVDKDKLQKEVSSISLRRRILQLDAMGAFLVEDGKVYLADNALVVRNPRKLPGRSLTRRGRILDRHMEVLAETVTDEKPKAGAYTLSGAKPEGNTAAPPLPYGPLRQHHPPLTTSGKGSERREAKPFSSVVYGMRRPSHRKIVKRWYPAGEETFHAVGYASEVYGNSGIEDACSDVLISPKVEKEVLKRPPRINGRTEGERLSLSPEPRASIFEKLLFPARSGAEVQNGSSGLRQGSKSPLNEVILTLSKHLQNTAYQSLGEHRGAVIALNVKTGEILALVSKPSFDPNQPAGKKWVIASRNKETQPFLNRALQQRYPPGSTFKVVTAAAILQREDINPLETIECRGVKYAIRDNKRHGTVALKRALTISCNSYFAGMGVRLGKEYLTQTASQFGFGRTIELVTKYCRNGDVPSLVTVPSISIPDNLPCKQKGLIAQSAIGQYEVRVTPLQMALVAAAVANDGVIMCPHIIKEIRSPSSTLKFSPKQFSVALRPMIARQLREMMTLVVEEGTGRRLKRIYKIVDDDGVKYKTSYAKNLQSEIVCVAGKTGTAEVGREGEKPHSWFIGFAPANYPQIAVCVLVENAGWGSVVAGPIAIEMLTEALAEQVNGLNIDN